MVLCVYQTFTGVLALCSFHLPSLERQDQFLCVRDVLLKEKATLCDPRVYLLCFRDLAYLHEITGLIADN